MYTPQISACCLAFAPGKPKAFRNRERSYGWKNVCDGFSPLFRLTPFRNTCFPPLQESQCRCHLFMRRQTTRLRIGTEHFLLGLVREGKA
jgi:hypothetical protein